MSDQQQPSNVVTEEVEAWLEYQTTYNSEELLRGDGNHPDEIDALRKFLNGTLTAEEAAVAITAPISRGGNPPGEQYRLWGLLADAIAEHGQEVSRKSLDLLIAIVALPRTPELDWSNLTKFSNFWSDMYGSQHQGPPQWEYGKEGLLSEERKAELCGLYVDEGVAEANMWLELPDALGPELGYDALNLSCSGREGLYIYVHYIHGWLKTAGLQLRRQMELAKVMSLKKSTFGDYAEATMEEHWIAWEAALAELGEEESPLPSSSKQVAKECLATMQDARRQDLRTAKA